VACGAVLATLAIGTWLGVVVVGSEHVSLGEATRGGDLLAGTRRFLRETGIVEPDEPVLWFYSRGLFAVRENGNLLTDTRAIVYDTAEDGSLDVRSVDYPSMVRVYDTFRDPAIGDVTGVRIDVGDGSQFFLAMGDADAEEPEALRDLRERVR